LISAGPLRCATVKTGIVDDRGVGRIGCLLAGDGDYGVNTTLPWGVDFGDGIRRHPTQLYDVAFLALLGFALTLRARRPWVSGRMFRGFMLGYLGWRFAVEFIKPREIVAMNLSAIQIASLLGVAACATLLWARRQKTPAHQALLDHALTEVRT